jgi:hypothetical protein
MFFFVISPLVGWSLPALLPFVVAAAAGCGYKELTRTDSKGLLRSRLTRELENLDIVSIPLEEIVEESVGDEIARDDRIVFEHGKFRLVFRRDARGKFFVDALGPKTTPRTQLIEEAKKFAQEIVQQFVYDRVTRELDVRGIHMVSEEVEEKTGDIVLEMRRYR